MLNSISPVNFEQTVDIPDIQSSKAFCFITQKIQECFNEALSYNCPNITEPSPQQCKIMANRLIEWVRERDQLKPHKLPSVERLRSLFNESWWIAERTKTASGEEKIIQALQFDSLFIGSGGQFNVCLGITEEGSLWAIKEKHDTSASTTYSEEIYDKIPESPHIIRRFTSTNNRIIEEFYPYSLDKVISGKKNPQQMKNLLEKYRDRITLGIMRGVAHLHHNGFVHGDIKLANLLVNDEGMVKISDFGLANYSDTCSSKGGTHVYSSPEQMEYFSKILDEESPLSLGSAILEGKMMQAAEVWQTMLVLLAINFDTLSVPFCNRFTDYLDKIYAISDEINLEITTPGDRQQFMERSKQYIESLQRPGLFSDLPATNALEELLDRMSMFDSENRSSIQKALETLESFV